MLLVLLDIMLDSVILIIDFKAWAVFIFFLFFIPFIFNC